MLHFAFTLVLFLCSTSIHGQDVVYITSGELSGKIMTTRNGRNISAYLGIRYAEPPIGQLRFKNPQPWYRWNEVVKADTDGNDCPQFNDDGKFVGDEDCLFLNVYSLNTFPEEFYPVMVYFHGGDYFSSGSGSSTNAGPEYLMDKDIVLVTVNYRLGVFGFLSTGDATAPGNFGLKDQLAALQWVQKNIAYFGGHPDKVTIFGQGGGGVSTAVHAIFAPNSGLFSQYISQSGSPLAFWACEDYRSYRRRAFELGKYLNCPTENSQVLVNCLRLLDTYSLADSFDIFNDTEWVFNTWGPTTEPKLEGALITTYPLHEIMMQGVKDCPAIIGNVYDEGLAVIAEYYSNDTIYNTLTKDLLAYLKYVVYISFDANTSKKSAQAAKHFYFDDIQASDKKTFIQNLTNFLTDLAFRVPTELQTGVMYHMMKTPFYSYAFDYRGTFSQTSVTLGNNENIGVAHGDELTYLFPIKTSDIQRSKSDETMIDIMVDFWTSFAYTGTPTSEHISDPNIWKPTGDEPALLLKIGDNSDPTDMKVNPVIDERLVFWRKLLETLLAEFVY